ncbi:MAG: hypothetical protein KZY61_07740 [Clostridiaceae bacterium]|uniref:hypothetical protein n=1 Tax=Anaerosalibacter bizertensis TaxID=932217 RepID=UPI001D02B58D|nr:hypothetical protein [Anaerosalibacter bizertensis]MBV1820328.1 hypothetical protein [Bacteroidales bacterium MSK.15.36]MBW4827259.1 hypothetical protein [Clostridiaceae bacterium]MBW4859570.1 hypothetical protein [Clostridiaceae bacterium]MBW4868539.1 hypothetical protein [Clostridiaceae bacterium]MCB5558672.1 hypothetical protein [Anaerosalibacter bizertensis]
MFKNKNIRFMSLLVVILSLLNTLPSFATNFNLEENDTDITIQQIDEFSYIINENDEKILITQKFEKDKEIITLKNLENNEVNYFLKDNSKGTIYSSITENTIPIPEEPKESLSNECSNIVTLRSKSNNKKFLGTKTIKYTTIVALVGIEAGVTKIASAVLAFLGIPISEGIKNIVKIFEGSQGVTAGILALKHPNGGIKLDLYKVRRSKMQRGKRYYFWVKTYRNPRRVHNL